MNNTSLFFILTKALKDLIYDLPELEKNKRSISAGTIQNENHLRTEYYFSMEFLDKNQLSNNRIKD